MKKKRSLLPLLTVLFLFSYGLMTMLIVQQGSAIQSQSNLIKVLLRDSAELWTARGKAISDQQMIKSQGEEKAKAKNQAPSVQMQAPSAEGRSSQNPQVKSPSTQSPSTQSPSTQATPEHRSSHTGKFAKPQTQAPPVPTSDLVDRRRALTTI